MQADPVLIGVVLPTVDGREEMLAQVQQEYLFQTSDVVLRILEIPNRRTCGHAWNDGVADLLDMGVDYIHLGADDLVPRGDRIFDDAIEIADRGDLPCPYLYNADDTRWGESDGVDGDTYAFSRVPFLTREQAELLFPMPGLHYYSDCWLGSVGILNGIRSVLVQTYAFTHLWAAEGRIHDSEPDRLLYEREIAKLEAQQ